MCHPALPGTLPFLALCPYVSSCPHMSPHPPYVTVSLQAAPPDMSHCPYPSHCPYMSLLLTCPLCPFAISHALPKYPPVPVCHPPACPHSLVLQGIWGWATTARGCWGSRAVVPLNTSLGTQGQCHRQSQAASRSLPMAQALGGSQDVGLQWGQHHQVCAVPWGAVPTLWLCP